VDAPLKIQILAGEVGGDAIYLLDMTGHEEAYPL